MSHVMRRSLRLLLLAAATALAVPAARAADLDCASMTGAGREHALACKIFDAAAKPVSREALVSLVRSRRFVLLGEVHDNPDIHRERARLIADASRGREKPAALVFEHIREDQNGALEAFAERQAAEAGPRDGARSADDLLAALEWPKSGWPDAAMFKPLFVEAIAGRHAIYAGDAPKTEVRKVSREGLPAVSEADRTRLRLDEALARPLEDALLGELEASHCGLMPKTAFGNMALAQRYRDARIAAAMLAAAEAQGQAVLLAGNGHVRRDRAVPYQLARLAKDPATLVVEFLEVDDEKKDPAAYLPRAPDGAAAADFVVLMPRAERPDPCEEMRKRFKK